MKRLFTALAGVLAATALSGVLSVAQATEAPDTIRLAVPDLSAGNQHSSGGVVDVLRSQQIYERAFAEQGIEVQWLFFKGAGPVINEALANGQVDFAYLGDLAAIVGKASGLDTKLLSASVRGIKQYLGVVPGSGIKTLDDLKGRRVAIFRGTATQLSFDAALASQGLKERDFQVINLDFNAASSALVARQIDATWGLSNLLALRERGLVDVPLSTQDLGGVGSIQGVLVGRGAFVERYPQVVARLLEAQQQAVQWLHDEGNKVAYIELVAELANYPATILQQDLEQERFAERFDPRLDAVFLQHLQASVDLAAEQRLIRKGFVVEQWAEPRFLEAALATRNSRTAAHAP